MLLQHTHRCSILSLCFLLFVGLSACDDSSSSENDSTSDQEIDTIIEDQRTDLFDSQELDAGLDTDAASDIDAAEFVEDSIETQDLPQDLPEDSPEDSIEPDRASEVVYYAGESTQYSVDNGESLVVSNEIRFEFAKPYAVGQYANGDWWVYGEGAAVEIVAIEPASAIVEYPDEDGSTITRTVNGAMVNPPNSGSQSYDSKGRDMGYDEANNLDPGQTSTSLVITTSGQPISVVKAVSMPAHHAHDDGRPILQDHAVLTVVDSIPAPNELRPAYTGADKSETTGILSTDIDVARLQYVAALSSTPTAESSNGRLRRVIVTHNTNWTQRDIHAANNVPSAYGAYLYDGLSPLLAALATSDLESVRQDIGLRVVQHGLDLHGIVLDGGSWDNNGGHNVGRKLLYTAAAVLLDHGSMLAVANNSSGALHFQDDQQTFFVTQEDVDNTLNANWDPDDRAPAQTYASHMIGMPEWCIRHYTHDDQCNFNWGATYRGVNTNTTLEQYVLMRLLGLETAWNYPAYAAFNNRAMGINGTTDWAQELYDTYLEPTRPGVPTELSFDGTTLSWNPVAGATGYEIFAASAENLNYFSFEPLLELSSWQAGSYELRVIAFTDSWTYSPWSEPLTITLP